MDSWYSSPIVRTEQLAWCTFIGTQCTWDKALSWNKITWYVDNRAWLTSNWPPHIAVCFKSNKYLTIFSVTFSDKTHQLYTTFYHHWRFLRSQDLLKMAANLSDAVQCSLHTVSSIALLLSAMTLRKQESYTPYHFIEYLKLLMVT